MEQQYISVYEYVTPMGSMNDKNDRRICGLIHVNGFFKYAALNGCKAAQDVFMVDVQQSGNVYCYNQDTNITMIQDATCVTKVVGLVVVQQNGLVI